jgi:hypothetical protein
LHSFHFLVSYLLENISNITCNPHISTFHIHESYNLLAKNNLASKWLVRRRIFLANVLQSILASIKIVNQTAGYDTTGQTRYVTDWRNRCIFQITAIYTGIRNSWIPS